MNTISIELRTKLFFTLAVCVLCCACSGSGPTTEPEQPATARLLMPSASGDLVLMPAGKVRVFVYARTDCPISNRYAPEIRRIFEKYKEEVDWWLIFPNPKLARDQIEKHLKEFDYPFPAFHDSAQQLVNQSEAKVTPEVAVYGKENQLVYSGRIDDRYVSFGKARPEPTEHNLEMAIDAALANKMVSPSRHDPVGCYIKDMVQ